MDWLYWMISITERLKTKESLFNRGDSYEFELTLEDGGIWIRACTIENGIKSYYLDDFLTYSEQAMSLEWN